MVRTLYISARCEHCIRIIKGFGQYPFLKDIFEVVNIDTTPFPNNITSVPSIIMENQVISGDMVFEYLGKIVEGKNQQEVRDDRKIGEHTRTMTGPGPGAGPVTGSVPGQFNKQENTDGENMNQCMVNEDGEIEGYCCDEYGLSCSLVTDQDDNNTTNFHSQQSLYDFIGNDTNDKEFQQKLTQMEFGDKKIEEERGSLDSDLERLQRERGELMKN